MPHKIHTFRLPSRWPGYAPRFSHLLRLRARRIRRSQDASRSPTLRGQLAPPRRRKTAKVISDEDIDKTSYKPGGLNVGRRRRRIHRRQTPREVKADLKADEAATCSRDHGECETRRRSAIARAREALAEAAAKLDLLKRANALDQDTYYSKPNYTTITMANRSSTRSRRRSTINKRLSMI